MTPVGVVVAVVVLIASSVIDMIWSESAIRRFFLHAGRNQPRRTALLVVASHLAWLVAALVVAKIVASTTSGSHPATPVGLALSPLLVLLGAYALPWLVRWHSDMLQNCADFVAAGATPATARAFYWSGLPFAYLALFLCVLALVSWFPE